jgi:hypothetical protein
VSHYKVIADVGQTLVNLIWEAINNDQDLKDLINSPNLISLESPAEHQENNDQALLSVYLYRITEDPFLKNQPSVEGTGGRIRKAPMALDLYYLITPLLKAPRDQQIVLGKVMQIFYDRPMLDGPETGGTALADSGEVVRIVFNAVPLQEVSWVWQALETPYRLSVSYAVRVTLLDSTEEQLQQRVLTNRNMYGQRKDPVPVGVET